MATILPVINTVGGFGGLDGYQVTWGPMANGDVGAPVGSTIYAANAVDTPAPGGGFMSGFADKTVQVVGTFGAGGSVALEGSNDGGVNWFALSNASAQTIAITSPALQEVIEAVIWLRPHVTAGDGTTSLTVTMFLRKTQVP